MARPALILGVVALLLVLCALGSSFNMPFILAHKKASLTRLKFDAERVSISIDIYNQGSSCVYSQSILQSPI
jgi:translocon-associated protein subunit beta